MVDTEMPAREPKRDRTILLAGNARELNAALTKNNFSVTTWPKLSIQPPASFATLDEAIENLFGYDWLIFVNQDAARAFLIRVDERGHDVSELDSLRVCALGEHTAAALEQRQVHVDVIATHAIAVRVIGGIADYVGGSEHLRRL